MSCYVGFIGTYKPTSIVDLIIFPLRHFLLIVFVSGHTLFRWADTAMRSPVFIESATAGFYSFDYGLFFVVGARAIFLHTCTLSIQLYILDYSLINYVSYHIPRLFSNISYIHKSCSPETSPSGCTMSLTSFAQKLFPFMLPTHAGHLCHTHVSRSISCCYNFSHWGLMSIVLFLFLVRVGVSYHLAISSSDFFFLYTATFMLHISD